MKSLVLSILLSAQLCFAVDMVQLEKELTTTGALGWVHGAVNDHGLYVFTYRNPKNFFDSIQMSLLTEDPQIRTRLETLGRHDRVRVVGSFMENPSPQKHIMVKSLELVTKYEPEYKADAYKYDAKLPEDLLNQTEAMFLVHALVEEGKILVVEYKDTIVPIFVRNPALTKDLWRNDVVKLTYTVQRTPDRPVHIRINERAPEPVKVVESMKALHGKPANFEGALIMFPQSPDIKFNVFAIQQDLSDGLKRQFTLINFDDQEKFAQIRAALQKAWDKFPGQFENARNKLVSKRLRVRAKGTFNEVSPSQANPQILLKDVSDIEITEQ